MNTTEVAKARDLAQAQILTILRDLEYQSGTHVSSLIVNYCCYMSGKEEIASVKITLTI